MAFLVTRQHTGLHVGHNLTYFCLAATVDGIVLLLHGNLEIVELNVVILRRNSTDGVEDTIIGSDSVAC